MVLELDLGCDFPSLFFPLSSKGGVQGFNGFDLALLMGLNRFKESLRPNSTLPEPAV